MLRALEIDPRFSSYVVHETSDEIVEVRRGDDAVALVHVDSARARPELLAPLFERAATGALVVIVVGEADAGELDAWLNRGVFTVVADPVEPTQLSLALRNGLDHVELRARAESRGRWVRRYRYELGELIEIARAITRERDLDRLLGLILEKSRFITGSDAGSIYVVEGPLGDVSRQRLQFKLSQNESREFVSREFTMPITTRSVAGAAVLSRSFINIPDVYAIPPDASYGFDRTYDEKSGYRTRSMLTVPMVSAEGDVIGVIQLINKKRDPSRRLMAADDFEHEVVAYDERSEELLATLAAQAGIALENALLYGEIRGIFEGFVRASIEAIEQRDPTTSGHSVRVSKLTLRLAEATDAVSDGSLADIRFTPQQLRELEYASLLHDVGKIGVREQVLVKAKKLYPHQLEAISARLAAARQSLEVRTLHERLAIMARGGSHDELVAVDVELARKRAELEDAWRIIVTANEPTVLREGDFARVTDLARMVYVDTDGESRWLLSPQEAEALQITRGSLTSTELEEIRRHVINSHAFLARIAWGKNFARVPEIAGAHHEMLNGTGYPRGLKGDEIPIQSRIMTIADIFDALTASDRPYKKAVPVPRALDILHDEARSGRLDTRLLALFVEARVYEVVVPHE
ncbi:MAG: GAF domain-containing protein [Deltaproteobacteria bacterium]|nr:GAF domain-containing protein [Deltaproteobacteria bacterium]